MRQAEKPHTKLEPGKIHEVADGISPNVTQQCGVCAPGVLEGPGPMTNKPDDHADDIDDRHGRLGLQEPERQGEVREVQERHS